MARIMAESVVLRDPESDAVVALLPGQECPEWAEKVIANESVFAPEAEVSKPRRTASKAK